MSLQEKSKQIEETAMRRIGRGGVEQLYQALLRLTFGSPTLEAANSLFKAIKNGGNVIISSGFTIISAERCETDGPIGSVVLGKLVDRIGGHVVFLTDPSYRKLFESVGRSAGLSSFEPMGFPVEHDLAKPETTKIFNEFSPVALIAVERPGWNQKSVYHNMSGLDISYKTAKVDYIFNYAHSIRTPTIGIGDGGNEIGMGNVLDTVRKHVPFGSACRCPCGGGIASVTGVDHLIVSSVSNWGAYGLTAILGEIAGLPFEHDPSDERMLIKAALKAGAVDGVSGKSIAAVDGVDIETNVEVVKAIHRIVKG
jgi:hypothetical protein